jgi:LuxR family maltose regulon positive regulatory protein
MRLSPDEIKDGRPLQSADGADSSKAARILAQGPSSSLVEPLTARELDVLALLAQGLTNKEIAQRLVISPGTVKQHAYNLYQKLQVGNRQQAVKRASDLEIRFPE